jgi:hypothetical protein
MSTRYEFVTPGQGFSVWDRATIIEETGEDDDVIQPDDVALVLGDAGSCAVVLVGSPAELRSFLLQAHNQLPPAPEFVPAPTDTMRPRPRR